MTNPTKTPIPTMLEPLHLRINSHGWRIFPCGVDKKPLTQHGFKDATDNRFNVLMFWQKFPDALIGIPCADNGFFAVDLDEKNGCHGIAEFERLAAGRPCGCGPIQKTPSGGLHRLYKLPSNVAIPNNAGKLAPGVDLRSNGYICTGTGYAWQAGGDFTKELEDAPTWLLTLISQLSAPRTFTPPTDGELLPTSEAAHILLDKALDKAHIGNRDEIGFWLACQLRDAGIPQGEARRVIRSYQAEVNEPTKPYTPAEAIAKVNSAYRRAPRNPAPSVCKRTNNHG
jgi:hypothetical protein